MNVGEKIKIVDNEALVDTKVKLKYALERGSLGPKY
jgi:hypothetical protein